MSFGKVRRKKAWGGREKEEHVLFLLVSRKSNCELCFFGLGGYKEMWVPLVTKAIILYMALLYH
jgi:hypothetical protein